MANSRITRESQADVKGRKSTRSHVLTTCRIPFGSGKSVTKSRAIAGLRKLAKHMNRGELVLNKNLYPTHIERISHETRPSNVFMGFDSPPLYSSPKSLDFQPKYDGVNAPAIDNTCHQSSAGILMFMTEKHGGDFVHLHELGQGRTIKCTSQVCFQEYQAQEFNKKQRRKYNDKSNTKKRKRNVLDDATEAESSERKRMKCHQKTFKALCDAWKSDLQASNKLLNPPVTFDSLPLDLKLMIWDYVIPSRTVIINPQVVCAEPKVLHIDSRNPNTVLLYVNREFRYGLLELGSTIRLTDSNGPTDFVLDCNKDTVVLLGLGFLRTTSLPGSDQIAKPFSKIKKLAIPWTSTGWSATHIAFMPSMFKSLQKLTVLGFHGEITEAAKWGSKSKMSPVTDDFRYANEMAERKKWILETFQQSGREIDVQLKIFEKIRKKQRAERERR